MSELTLLFDWLGTSGYLAVSGLVIARLFPIVLLVPFLGGRFVPLSAKLAVLAALTVAVVPTFSIEIALEAAAYPLEMFVVLALKEAAIGLCIGFLCALIFYGAKAGGNLIDAARGQNVATSMLPHLPDRRSPTALFVMLATVVLVLLVDGHHLFIRALLESFDAVPVTGFWAPEVTAGAISVAIVETGGVFFLVAAAFSLPVLLALFLVDMVIGFISRIAHPIHGFFLSLPAKAMVGILVLLVVLSAVFDLVIWGFARGEAELEVLIREMTR